MSKIAGFIYAIIIITLITPLNILLSYLFSVDITILFLADIIGFLSLIWYKLNVDGVKE